MGQSKVTIKGTGQLNGNVVINKTVEMDSVMANKFMGSSRYEVIEAFLNTNYPGVKVNPKNFGVMSFQLNLLLKNQAQVNQVLLQKAVQILINPFFQKQEALLLEQLL